MDDEQARREVREQLVAAKRRDLLLAEEQADLPGITDAERTLFKATSEVLAEQVADLEAKLAG